MKIQKVSFYPNRIFLPKPFARESAFLSIMDEQGREGWGEISPLPSWSKETLSDVFAEWEEKKSSLLKQTWQLNSCRETLASYQLLPSFLFGLESALFSILDPIADCKVDSSALFMGSFTDVLLQAKQRKKEGFTYAKVKVSSFTFEEAFAILSMLKKDFRLRVDVNRAWDTEDSLRFFAQFSQDDFDYIEEPLKNPHDLRYFSHPFAVDESFPLDLCFEELASFPLLRAMIYKPTLQGGMTNAQKLLSWTSLHNICFVASSSFESLLGLTHIAFLAHRFRLPCPSGLGTYHFLQKPSTDPLFPLSDSDFEKMISTKKNP